MINGAHAIVYSRDPEADRAFFNEFFGLPHIDAGEDWLIFGLPPPRSRFTPQKRTTAMKYTCFAKTSMLFPPQCRPAGLKSARSKTAAGA